LFNHNILTCADLLTSKAAYECIYTLFSIATLPAPIIAAQFTALHAALSDDAEVKQLTLLTLQKAVELHPDTTFRYLSGFVDQFRKIVDAKAKENAVKQEIERMEETKRGVLRLALDASRKYPTGISSEWAEWWTQVGKEHANILKEVADGEGKGAEVGEPESAARRRR
jgi:cullin-associated NEDD8-dissociated protein 1